IQSDLYGLGATMFSVMTGDSPKGSAAATTRSIWDLAPVSDWERPRARSSLRCDLEAICLKCLSSNPKLRYTSADAVARDLRQSLAFRPISSRKVGPTERLQLFYRRNSAAVIAVAVACMLGFIVSGFLLVRANQSESLAIKSKELVEVTTRN